MNKPTVKRSRIPWCQYQWPCLRGCCGPEGRVKNPQPCEWCYARSRCRRFHVDFTPRLCEENFPATWPTKPSIVFLAPEADLWSAGVPQEWRDRVFAEVLRAQKEGILADVVALTKRPQEITEADRTWFRALKHLWVGVSITRPAEQGRFAELCKVGPLEGRRVISYEPLLESGVWGPNPDKPNWVLIGPRTPVGKQAPGIEQAAKDAVHSAQELGIPVFVKPAAAKAWRGVPIVQQWPGAMYYQPMPKTPAE